MEHALRIEGDFNIYRAAELKPVLLASPPPGAVDLSAVTDFDTAGLQLLFATQRAARAAGREFRLLAPSPAVAEVFELMHLGAQFDIAPLAETTEATS